MDDITLRQNILDELEFDPSIDAASIGVAVDNGIVTLTGRVSSYSEKQTAEGVVKRVKGVRGIAEEIEVKVFSAYETSDEDIARRAANLIDWNVSVPKDTVQVKVQKGWVTLTGKVEWQYQKNAAAETVRDLGGVVGLSNLIEIAPRVSAADVKKRIEDAFKRDAELESQGIRVEVSGGSVTLRGKVHTWSERRAAERAAWSAPGIKTLNDQIAVG
ncbi:BON domain-containing protein [Rhizobium leguminosarum bv. viciae]|uniref:BON domain-containing protein n=1 Tax=Rhizobium TaxID=379 RepID=UPI0004068DE8|nr:BON domain-containing protein [Rhizobium leguminosarum]MBY5344437.1 BON domain-containing protein [Rhizobium leguminosarum]NEK46576.1 BON domain-containing protein [Rhizobium leguminosarum]NKK53028.1 BON domain-containing protein [Rhizobium leguminosarum bv. viciae]NKL23611.1 BON domain-containing protein [Rhizobium leguminosarum bv. viciae]NKL57605.1 BON domain-containing protein [Rhizobium leguminosarum bv. viciae]